MRDLDARLNMAIEPDPFGNPKRRRLADIVEQEHPSQARVKGCAGHRA